jgi:hypothetical protein
MKFATILIIVIIGYVILYVGMIVYDLFFKKDLTALMPKPEDEDIDISDEAGKFQPILIEKERPAPQPEERPVVDEPPEPPNKGDWQAQEDKLPQEEAAGDATTEEAPLVESHNEPKGQDVEVDQHRNRKPLSEVLSSEPTSSHTQKGNVNVSSDPARVKELIADLRKQASTEGQMVAPEIEKKDKNESLQIGGEQSAIKEPDLHSPSESEQAQEDRVKAAQPQVVKPKAASNNDSRTQAGQPKVTTEEEDYRAVLHMRVHINEEAKHTRFSDFMTAEELSNAVKKAAEDPEELALREIENGWRLIRKEQENEELEAMMASGQLANNTGPNVTIGKLSKN